MKLIYGPVLTRVEYDESWHEDELEKALRVENPSYNPSLPENSRDTRAQPFVNFYSREQGGFLTGHTSFVQQWAEYRDLNVEHEGCPAYECPDVDDSIIPGITLKPYQMDSLKLCLMKGRGVMEIATGGGKTEVAIATVLALGIPKTLYLCPDQASMWEMHGRFLNRGLTKDDIGLLGDGVRDTHRSVTIAVINSVAQGVKRDDEQIMHLLRSVTLFFSDEVHHQATAYTWQLVASECLAPRRIGMSGTPYKDNRSRFNPAYLHYHDSWLCGYFGDTLIHISPKKLQGRKQLTQCKVMSFPGGGSWVPNKKWHTVYEKGVIENEVRNRRIVTLASNLCDLGGHPLISVDKLEHGRILQRMMQDLGIDCVCSYGSGKLYVPEHFAKEYADEWEPVVLKNANGKKIGEEKGYVLLDKKFPFREHVQAGHLRLIGSKIYDEALDLPFLTDFINAAGGKASQRFRQKIGRILRLWKGKHIARFWDPWDTCHFYLQNHSKTRLKIAEEEGYEILTAIPAYYELRFSEARLTRRIPTMKLTEIEVEVSMTIAVPDFQNIKPTVRLKATLEEGDDQDEAYKKLSSTATALFYREAWNHAFQMDQIRDGGVVAAAKSFLGGLKKSKEQTEE